MNQQQFLKNDECIMVDAYYNILGHRTKLECHRLRAMTSKGVLHRAFSLFLFNNEGKLLLQQRTQHKITFPNVWTNTCYSHPLYGLHPSEVDLLQDVRSGRAVGAKRAAVRKLQQELGTDSEPVSIEEIKFLTRVHYCAADAGADGANAEWGEHEIDYILFVQKEISVKPNPGEVKDVRYVSYDELMEMMKPD